MLSLVETIRNTNLSQKLLLCIEDLAGFTVKDSSATSTSETANRYKGHTHARCIQNILQEDLRLGVAVWEIYRQVSSSDGIERSVVCTSNWLWWYRYEIEKSFTGRGQML